MLIMDFRLFLMLVAGLYLADFALQDDFMVKNKADAGKTAMGFHVLTAHAAIQGLVAGLLFPEESRKKRAVGERFF